MDPNIQLQLEKALDRKRHDSGNELCRLLPRLPEPKRDIKVFGQSIALLSAQAGWWDVVDQLVNKYGCIPSNDEIDPMNGRTILHYACDDDKAKSKIVEMLTTVCLFNPMQEDNDQETPFDLSGKGMKKQFLKDLIDQSKGFENVVDYLNHKRDKSIHQTMTKAVSETDDNALSLYKLYICGKPGAGTIELKHLINLQEPTNRKKKIFVTDFNIADHQIETPDSLGVFYCIHSHFIVSIRLPDNADNDPNYELIDRMCQLAKSIADRTKQKFIPKVFIVTTRVDDRKNTKYLQKLNEKLNEKLESFYSEVLVSLSDKKQFIYQIDTAVEGNIRKQCADELQKHIFLAIDQPGVEPIKLPKKWFELLKHLDNETGIVSKSQCYDKKLKMRPDDIERALTYLESMMLLYRCPDEDIILTKIDIFIEKLLSLLKSSSDKESMLLRKRGLFKKTLLRKRCTDPTRDILSDDIFLKLLERFRLAACTTGGVAGASGRGVGGGDEFFIPNILSTESLPDELEHEGGISPLALVWDQHVLPHGFFLAFVTELNILGKKDHYRFQPCNDETSTIKSIHLIEANQRLPGVMKLTDNGKWIGVSYSRGANPDYCPLVLNIIDRGIQQVIKLYESTGITSPIIRCVCPLCKENDHYCYAYSSQHKFVICSKTPSNTGTLTTDIQYWLQGSRIKHKEETSVISRVHPEKDQPVDSRTLYSTNNEEIVAVLKVMEEIADWSTLALILGIKHSVIERIKRDGYDEPDKIKMMVIEWLNSATASWNGLVLALNNPLVKRNDLAMKLSEEHPWIPGIPE